MANRTWYSAAKRWKKTTIADPAAAARADQKADAAQLAEDAKARGWVSEADRHRKLIARLDDLIAKAQAG